MALYPIPDTLKDLEKFLMSKKIWFKKIAVVNGKSEFLKIKGNNCNIPIEAANICHISQRLTISNFTKASNFTYLLKIL